MYVLCTYYPEINVFYQLCISRRTVRSWNAPFANTMSLLSKCWLWIRDRLDTNLFPNLKGSVGQFTRKLKTSFRFFLQCVAFFSSSIHKLSTWKISGIFPCYYWYSMFWCDLGWYFGLAVFCVYKNTGNYVKIRWFFPILHDLKTLAK